ncbi:MAG: LLM class flavin-dependent oxidoreductase [SAR202 cluster bacterium]|nr:LLM class flavin-dependent oxidoreductase [SAR202 cluster bacterium]
MKIGIELAIKTPVNEIEQAIKLCEKYNLDRIWIPDSNISLWEFWSILGVTANVTNNIRIGAGVTSPYQRNPVVMAQAAITIDQLSNGRLDIALGRGSRFWLSNIGIEGIDDGLNESFDILKSLFAGEDLDYSGNQFNIKSPALRQPTFQETIPIFIANTSEYWTEKAIKFADGIHTYTTNKNLLSYMDSASNSASKKPFYKISTIGYIQPKEVETWWVSNFSKNKNLQVLCKRDSENIDLEELKNDLTFDNKRSLQKQISKLADSNFDELMIAYRRPEDLEYILQTIKDCT